MCITQTPTDVRAASTAISGSPSSPVTSLLISAPLAIASLAPGGPAENSGVRTGDRVLAVDGQAVTDLAELWRAVWSCGGAGATVRLKLARSRGSREVSVVSGDRATFLKHPRMH